MMSNADQTWVIIAALFAALAVQSGWVRYSLKQMGERLTESKTDLTTQTRTVKADLTAQIETVKADLTKRIDDSQAIMLDRIAESQAAIIRSFADFQNAIGGRFDDLNAVLDRVEGRLQRLEHERDAS